MGGNSSENFILQYMWTNDIKPHVTIGLGFKPKYLPAFRGNIFNIKLNKSMSAIYSHTLI
jgi:hypothetical protein